jgi:hypothetical protein
MEVYPATPGPKASNAEKYVFQLLANADLGAGHCAFHSLLLPDHAKKFIGQADFVVLSPLGFLSLEVKGGTISTSEGYWYTKTSGGKVSKLPENPWQQSEGNMYALLDQMKNSGMPLTYKINLCGFGVMFPECSFQCRAQGTILEVLFDKTHAGHERPIRKYIDRLSAYWTAQLGYAPTPLTGFEWRKLKDWLSPTFYGVESISARRDVLHQDLVALRDEQMRVLAAFSANPRITCDSPAGTGKSVLAIALTELEHNAGKAAALVVPTTLFAGYLKERTSIPDRVFALEELGNVPAHSLDFVAIDEAQDLMSGDALGEISNVLKDGIEKGSWTIFLDAKNQSGLAGSYDPEWLDYIYQNSARMSLSRNIRNTSQVIEFTKSLTGRDIGQVGSGEGSPVEYIPYDSMEDAVGRLKKLTEKLCNKGLCNGDICLLTKNGVASPLPQALKGIGIELRSVSPENIRKYPFQEIACSPFTDFKGMEAFAVIADLSELTEDELQGALTYVAITRSVALLFVCYPIQMELAISTIQMAQLRRLHAGGAQ